MTRFKKHLLAVSMISSAVLFSNVAQAGDIFTEGWLSDAYVGLDITKAHIDFQTKNSVPYRRVYHDSISGMSGYLGYRFSSMWSGEISYMETSEKNKSVNTLTTDASAASIIGSTTTAMSQMTIDGLARYEILDDLFMMGSLGMERSTLNVSRNLATTAGIESSKAAMSWRLGVGMKYLFSKALGARIMYRYSDMSFGGVANGINYFSIGLSYDF